MTHEQEVKVLQEMQRHQQALDDISSGKVDENEISEEDAFINEMKEMNKTSSNLPKQENEFLNFLEEEKFKN
jgi:hypothetical protein